VKQETFEALKAEYVRAKKLKTEGLHEYWRIILNEYGVSNFEQLLMAIEGRTHLDESAFITINGRVASLNVIARKMVVLATLKNPEFRIDNEHPWDEPIAAVLEQAFNVVKERIDWTPEMRKVVLSAVLFGTGFAKIGLSSQYVYGETAWADDIPAGTDNLAEIDRLLPYGPTTEFQNFAIKDEWPSMVWVPSTDIFFNPGARRANEVARTYHRQRRRLVDVKHDVRYSKKARREIAGLSPSPRDDDFYLTEEQYSERLDDAYYCEIVECFDHASRQFCVFAEGCTVPLRDWTPFGLPIDNPYFRLTPIEHPETLWGISYASLLLNHSQAMNHLRAVLIDQIQRDGKRIHFIDPSGSRQDDFVDRINAASHGEFIEYDGLKNGERPPVHTVEFGGASAEILRLMSMVESDQAWVSGLTDAARNTPGNDTTATEINSRNQQQGLNVEQFVQKNEEFQEECAAAICQIMVAEWPEEKMVRIVGPSPELYFWVPLERRRVLNNFNIKIVAGSTERVDKLTYRRQWGEILPQIMAIADRIDMDKQRQMQGMPTSPLNLTEILRITLEMFDTTLPHKILNQRDPAQLAIRLIQQHGIVPVNMSPELEAQLRAMIAQGRQLPNMQQLGAPGQERTPAAPAQPQLAGGAAPQDMAGNISGRMLSEAGAA
jgi:hypothetical protein